MWRQVSSRSSSPQPSTSTPFEPFGVSSLSKLTATPFSGQRLQDREREPLRPLLPPAPQTWSSAWLQRARPPTLLELLRTGTPEGRADSLHLPGGFTLCRLNHRGIP